MRPTYVCMYAIAQLQETRAEDIMLPPRLVRLRHDKVRLVCVLCWLVDLLYCLLSPKARYERLLTCWLVGILYCL